VGLDVWVVGVGGDWGAVEGEDFRGGLLRTVGLDEGCA